MTFFDQNRLHPGQYTLSKTSDVLKLQKTFIDFMEIVRDDPGYLVDKHPMINAFVSLIDEDQTFPTAARVIPELRLPRNHDMTEDTLINVILRVVKHRLPPPPLHDPENRSERLLITRRIRNTIEYLWTGILGENPSEAEVSEHRKEIQRLILDTTCLALPPNVDADEQNA